MGTQQIRKFEQDAIVDTIVDKARAKLQSKRDEHLKSDKPYKRLLSQANHVKALDKEIDVLAKEKTKICDLIRDGIQEWNSTRGNYQLEFSTYTGVLDFGLVQDYKLRNKVSNRVAIALLPKDSINNIEEIIASIANDITA